MVSVRLTEYCFGYNFIENPIFGKNNLKPVHKKMYENNYKVKKLAFAFCCIP